MLINHAIRLSQSMLHGTHHTRWIVNRNSPGTTKSSDPTDQRRLKIMTPGILKERKHAISC